MISRKKAQDAGYSVIFHFIPAGGLLISFQDNRSAVLPDDGVLAQAPFFIQGLIDGLPQGFKHSFTFRGWRFHGVDSDTRCLYRAVS